MKRFRHWLALTLNGLLVLLFGGVIFNLADARLVFLAGENLQEYLLRALTYVFYARAAVALAEAPVLRFGPVWKRAAAAAAAAAGAAAVGYLADPNLVLHTELIHAHRAGRRASTDEESLTKIFEYSRWQHRPSFVFDVIRNIPEEDGIAYFSDLGPYVLAAQLYPRRLYMLPEIFNLIFETDQFDWKHREDPMHPPVRRFAGKPVGYEDPAVMARLEAMLAERDIQWVIVYDMLHPEYSFYRRLPGK